jgi:hypothetical protein
MNLFYEAKKVLDKDGKVNALGPYGKQKLTGREIQTYFRRNKVKDKTVRKAVEVALDLGGAMDIAIKAIKDYYGNKILKAKEVQTALKFANESFTYNQSLNQISEENLVEKNLMPDIQKIVDTKGAKKVGGIMVDMFTASMINQIYNKVNDQNKKKMEKSNISTLVDIAQRMMQKMGDNLGEGTMAIGVFDSNPSEKRKAIAGMRKLVKSIKPSTKVGSPAGKKFFSQLDLKYISDDELADDFARPSNKNMTIKDLMKKHEKRLGIQFEEVEEGASSAAQRAAIAISKKEKAGKPGYDKEGKSLKKESIMDTYRQMWEDASDIVEVTDKEINAMKQLSKDAEKIKKNYQKIVNMGDKELKDKKYNKEYEDILKMSQSVLSLIGKLQTQKIINKESLEEKLSKADLKMIDMMYDKKGKLTDVGKAVMNYKPGDNIRKIVQNLNNKK